MSSGLMLHYSACCLCDIFTPNISQMIFFNVIVPLIIFIVIHKVVFRIDL